MVRKRVKHGKARVVLGDYGSVWTLGLWEIGVVSGLF